jgi:hypothetical protein
MATMMRAGAQKPGLLRAGSNARTRTVGTVACQSRVTSRESALVVSRWSRIPGCLPLDSRGSRGERDLVAPRECAPTAVGNGIGEKRRERDFPARQDLSDVGIAMLSGATVRYRFYTRWGVTPEDLSRIVFS